MINDVYSILSGDIASWEENNWTIEGNISMTSFQLSKPEENHTLSFSDHPIRKSEVCDSPGGGADAPHLQDAEAHLQGQRMILPAKLGWEAGKRLCRRLNIFCFENLIVNVFFYRFGGRLQIDSTPG